MKVVGVRMMVQFQVVMVLAISNYNNSAVMLHTKLKPLEIHAIQVTIQRR